MRRVFLVFALAALPAWPAPQAAATKTQIDIPGDKQWTDTGIDVAAGETLRITAEGTVEYPASQPSGPDGLKRGWMDLIRVVPVADANRGSLIGRIGSSDAARPFLVGPRRESRAAVKGRLFLGLNHASNEKATGSFKVTIERIAADPASAESIDISALPKLPQELLDSIPRRVGDKEGTPGDRTNFIVIGTEEKVRKALEAAGWVTVDRSVKDALLRGALASLSRQAYVTLPMSELYLFDRPQDYGYAQGDPLKVVASRHHFRIWKAPFTLDGQIVWVGAGTHDIGFDRDQRNNKVTHKIDPETDKERDYIASSFQETGMVAKVDYMTATNPVTKAKTAHGEEFVSDGRTVLIYLKPDGSMSLAGKFADVFCSVLKQKNPDTGDWGPCSNFLEGGGREDLTLGPLSSKYRVLVIPGIFSSCASDAPAFLEGREALKKNYGIEAELLQVPNDSSEDNARMIAAYLSGKMKDDPRKWILVGYSKGTPDLQVALATQKAVADAAVAFVSVAGASGGSPIADALPAQVEGYVRQFKFGKCEGDLSTGMKSLSKTARKAFLASYPHPIVPTYSLPAVSTFENTSKALQKGWQLMSAFDRTQDGQLAKMDAIVPESKILGTAKGDHFAVALPFDKLTDKSILSAMDKTRFPRAALLEAIVRVVTEDLDRK